MPTDPYYMWTWSILHIGLVHTTVCMGFLGWIRVSDLVPKSTSLSISTEWQLAFSHQYDKHVSYSHDASMSRVCWCRLADGRVLVGSQTAFAHPDQNQRGEMQWGASLSQEQSSAGEARRGENWPRQTHSPRTQTLLQISKKLKMKW